LEHVFSVSGLAEQAERGRICARLMAHEELLERLEVAAAGTIDQAGVVHAPLRAPLSKRVGSHDGNVVKTLLTIRPPVWLDDTRARRSVTGVS